jgi:hypothetical protein
MVKTTPATRQARPAIIPCQDKARLDIGQAHAIRPLVGADLRPMAALVIRAVDQKAANTGRAHFSQGDLVGPGMGQLNAGQAGNRHSRFRHTGNATGKAALV